MLARVRLLLVLALLAFRLALPATAEEIPPQVVTPITPAGEQRVEGLATGEQQVQMVDAQGAEQVVTGGTSNAAGRAGKAVVKVIVGTVAAVVSVGVMVASLMFF
jgi:hypothetical protein